MSGRRYVRVPRASLDRESPTATAFLAQLLEQRLRHGLPARRRAGLARSLVARAGLPRGPFAALIRRLPAAERPDLDRLLDRIAAEWPLGEPPAAISALALEARAGRTIFVFGQKPEPLLVAKLPGERARLEHEAAALDHAAHSAVAPRYLGRIGEAYVQEGLPGQPLSPSREPEWLAAHAELAGALTRLAAATRKTAVPEQLRERFVLGDVDPRARRTVESAERALRALDVSVLQHGDTSPQNCLAHGGRFAGLVDWERARFDGTPGFDLWNLAIASVEHGIGLFHGSDDALLTGFRVIWSRSRFMDEARSAARSAALAAGVPESLLEPLEIAFFARRVHARVRKPERYPTGPHVARAMLEIVCAG
jgi:aminoglycoside phosphotransferase